jgi:UDP-3-O-[3-hydroxymyristoyl] glucosamine N-acyltransferase
MNYRLRKISFLPKGGICEFFKTNPYLDIPKKIVNGEVLLFGDQYVLPLNKAREGSLSFCTMDDPVDAVYNSQASIVIVDFNHRDRFKIKKNQCLIFVDNVKLNFVKLLKQLVEDVEPRMNCNYRQNAKFRYSYIGPNVIIEEGVEVGCLVNIVGNSYIYSGTKIGDNVTIKPGTVIGGQGFGHVLDGDKYLLFPQIGGVVIEDDVRIGSNVCIDKGTLGNTILKRGCRIDNLVHIAHNVVVGENCLVTAGVIFGGSVVAGNNSHLGLSTTILQGAKIGDGAYIGIGSCITKDIEDNMLAYGVPAKIKGTVSKKLLEE